MSKYLPVGCIRIAIRNRLTGAHGSADLRMQCIHDGVITGRDYEHGSPAYYIPTEPFVNALGAVFGDDIDGACGTAETIAYAINEGSEDAAARGLRGSDLSPAMDTLIASLPSVKSIRCEWERDDAEYIVRYRFRRPSWGTEARYTTPYPEYTAPAASTAPAVNFATGC